MKLTSDAFREGQPIPDIHSCDGENRSPPLIWSDIPVSTRSFVLIVDDPDAPRGTWIHWVLFNLPADAVELSSGVPSLPELKSGARQGVNDSGAVGYAGPCPPPGKAHRYFFRLFALDCTLNLASGVTRGAVDEAIAGHVLAETVLMGTFQR
jgi:Raf kinase inhibitor-like YbhB/YbcL family protein